MGNGVWFFFALLVGFFIIVNFSNWTNRIFLYSIGISLLVISFLFFGIALGMFVLKLVISYEGMLELNFGTISIKWGEMKIIELRKVDLKSKTLQFCDITDDEILKLKSMKDIRKLGVLLNFSKEITNDIKNIISINIEKKLLEAIEKYAPPEINNRIKDLLSLMPLQTN